jgi:hypothetical protein
MRTGNFNLHKNITNTLNKFVRTEQKGLTDLKRLGVVKNPENLKKTLLKMSIINPDKEESLKKNMNLDFVYQKMM